MGKKFIFVGLFVFMFSLCLWLPELNADTKPIFPEEDQEPLISMDFQDANLKDILKVFSIQSGLNFIASEAVRDRKITLYLDKVPLSNAMDKLFKANNLAYELDKKDNIFIVKEMGKTIETVTKVFYLKYATVSSSSLKEEMSSQIKAEAGGGGGGEGKWKVETDVGITTAVKKLLSEAGSVIEDFRTNSLIVIDVPAHMEIISQLITSLDVSVPQVLLEVEMLDVSKNVVDKLGMDWADAGSFAMQVISAARMTTFPLSMFAPLDGIAGLTSAGDNTQKFTPGDLSFPTTLKLVFDYLRTRTDTKFLARPRLLTLSNETAEIRIATDETIGVTQTTSTVVGGATTATAERTETGVLLRVTPQVNAEAGEITMFIYPKVAEAIASTIQSDLGSFRDPEERSTKTMVRVKDGETVIIGGLIRNEFVRTDRRVPFLGDIPLIGALFRHKGGTSSVPDKNKERELLVFITPRIVKDTDVKLAQARKVAVPEREQETTSVFDRQTAIKASLNNFEKKR